MNLKSIRNIATSQLSKKYSAEEIFDYLFEDLIYHAMKSTKLGAQSKKLLQYVKDLEEEKAPVDKILAAMRKAHEKEQEDAAFTGVVDREFHLLGGTADLWMEMTNRLFAEAEKHAEMTGCEMPCNGTCPD